MNLPRGPENLCFDKDEFMKVGGGRRAAEARRGPGGAPAGLLRRGVAGSRGAVRGAWSLGRDLLAPPRLFPRPEGPGRAGSVSPNGGSGPFAKPGGSHLRGCFEAGVMSESSETETEPERPSTGGCPRFGTG